MSQVKEISAQTGRALLRGSQWTGTNLLRGGQWLGSQIATAYNAIDPDVRRHIAQVPLLSYSLFSTRHVEVEAGEPDGIPPLVFVHGLGGNRGNFLLMAGYFRLLGRKRSYSIHFDSGQTIEEMGEALSAFVDEVISVTGESKVEMVAHSMGGLISRVAIQNFGQSDNVQKLITLGTPHHGTFTARFANTDITRDLRLDSDFISKLNEKTWPKEVETVSLYSENDVFIAPAESAILEGSEAIKMDGFTHYSYLLSPRCWSTVWKALEKRQSGKN